MAKSKKAAKAAVPPKAAPLPALAIQAKDKKKLTPNQAAFNKLTARVEKLRADLLRKQKALDEALALYGQRVPALEQDLARQRREVLLLAWPFYEQRQLPKNQLGYLKDFLQELLQLVIQGSAEEPDEEVKAIFAQLEGETYDSVAQREEKELQDGMREAFNRAGIDTSDWEAGTELTEEALFRKMHEFQQKQAEQWANPQQQQSTHYKTRPKTGKQLQKEQQAQEAERLKQKSITTIYRQLAKLFHPDREQDESRRPEKEGLMQQLTEAYQSRDLQTLLLLEQQWIQNENGHIESLPEETLGIYLEMLRNQAKELEIEKWQLVNRPCYSAFIERYGYRGATYPVKRVKEDIADLENEKGALNEEMDLLRGPQALRYLKGLMRERAALQKQADKHDLAFLFEAMFSSRGR